MCKFGQTSEISKRWNEKQWDNCDKIKYRKEVYKTMDNKEQVFQPFREKEEKEWDVFISHASEDKEDFVRPLTEALQRRGVRVWYDEFELKLGNSLTDSINKGLQKSRYGIIVCSPAFFKKEWANYELKSLLMRQMSSERVILPIWHKIDKEFLKEKSLYLLDIKALSSEVGWEELIDGIMEAVRPDLLNSQFLLKMGRELHEQTKGQEPVKIPLKQLHASPVRHQSMPMYLVVASRLISEVFWDAMPMNFVDIVIDFARDLDYDREFIVWSAMANAYEAFKREMWCGWDEVSKKREAIELLLDYSQRGRLIEVEKLKEMNSDEYYYLIEVFVDNYRHITDMVGRYQ